MSSEELAATAGAERREGGVMTTEAELRALCEEHPGPWVYGHLGDVFAGVDMCLPQNMTGVNWADTVRAQAEMLNALPALLARLDAYAALERAVECVVDSEYLIETFCSVVDLKYAFAALQATAGGS